MYVGESTRSARLTAIGTLLFVCAARSCSEEGVTFSVPDSLLLFGNYNELRIVTPTQSQTLHPPIEEGYNRGYFAATQWRATHSRSLGRARASRTMVGFFHGFEAVAR